MASKIDQASIADDADDELKKDPARFGAKRKFDEFECPTCSANNPFTEFGNGDEVICGYCGQSFDAIVNDDGRLKLREN